MPHLAERASRRTAAILASLESLLSRLPRPRPRVAFVQPPVKILLDVDREYRDKAEAGQLPTIAPKRFRAREEITSYFSRPDLGQAGLIRGFWD